MNLSLCLFVCFSALFSQIMETVEPWYVSKEIIPVIKVSTAFPVWFITFSILCSFDYEFFLLLITVSYPAILSIARDTKFAVFYVQLRISQPGLYRSAWKFAWWFRLISDRFSPIVGDSPRDGRILGVKRGNMVGYASRWSTCFVLFAQLVESLTYIHTYFTVNDKRE